MVASQLVIIAITNEMKSVSATVKKLSLYGQRPAQDVIQGALWCILYTPRVADGPHTSAPQWWAWWAAKPKPAHS